MPNIRRRADVGNLGYDNNFDGYSCRKYCDECLTESWVPGRPDARVSCPRCGSLARPASQDYKQQRSEQAIVTEIVERWDVILRN